MFFLLVLFGVIPGSKRESRTGKKREIVMKGEKKEEEAWNERRCGRSEKIHDEEEDTGRNSPKDENNAEDDSNPFARRKQKKTWNPFFVGRWRQRSRRKTSDNRANPRIFLLHNVPKYRLLKVFRAVRREVRTVRQYWMNNMAALMSPCPFAPASLI